MLKMMLSGFLMLMFAVTAAEAQSEAAKRQAVSATSSGNLVELRALLEANPDLAKTLVPHPSGGARRYEVTLLYLAVTKGNKRMTEFLIDKGADVNSGTWVDDTDTRHTPLHVAAELGYAPVVELLIAKGARVDATDLVENTPLHYASQEGHLVVVRLLIANGADPNRKNHIGQTPIQYAKNKIIAEELRKGAKKQGQP